MSLLRRTNAAGSGEASPNQGSRPFGRSRQLASIHEQWQYASRSRVLAAAMSGDSRFIFAGTQDGDVLCFDVAGRLVWHAAVEGAVYRVALADRAECLVVGTVQRRPQVYLFNYGGQMLRSFETGGENWGVGVTPDASLIAVGSLDKHVYAFDRSGTLLFKRETGGGVRQVAVTPDGAHIFAGSDDHHVYAYDREGGERWRFATGARVWAGVAVAAEAGLLIAGSNDHYLYALDFEGREVWRYDTGGLVNRVAVTPDGATCAAAGQARTITVFNRQGHVLWDFNAGEDIYGLALTDNGRFVVAGGTNNTVFVADREHNYQTWQYKTRGKVYGVAVSSCGHAVAAASTDQTLYYFHNTEVPAGLQALTRPDNLILMRLIVQRVRDEYAANPHAGLISWFSEFEKSLRSSQFDVCRALLSEVHDSGSFALSDAEKQYTRSMEGVYWLFLGVAYHRLQQYGMARECYEKSRAIQAGLNNKDAVGQVMAALSSLPEAAPELVEQVARVEHILGAAPSPAPTEEEGAIPDEFELYADIAESEAEAALPAADVNKLLGEIINKPRVLGTSEKLLELRITQAPPAEQLQIVLLAKQSGTIGPLLKALEAEERVIRAAASAALALLEPGPDYGVLRDMLASSNTFVRWQALRILRFRAQQRAEEFNAAKEDLWPVALSPGTADTPNPLTRREEALLVREGGTEADTSWLVARLDDPDADVQLAVVEALGAVGSRDALPALRQAKDKEGFLGQSVKMAAAEAAQAIEARYPLPAVEKIAFCVDDPLQDTAVQAGSLFAPDLGTVYCVVELRNVNPGTPVTARWMRQRDVLREETQPISGEDGPPVADVLEIPVQDDRRTARPFQPRPGTRSPFSAAESEPAPFRRPFGRPADDAPRPAGSPYGSPLSTPPRPGGAPARPPLGGDRPAVPSPLRRPSPFDRREPDFVENIELPAGPAPGPAPTARPAPPPQADLPTEAEEEPTGRGILRRFLFAGDAGETPEPPAAPRSPLPPRPSRFGTRNRERERGLPSPPLRPRSVRDSELPDWLAAPPPDEPRRPSFLDRRAPAAPPPPPARPGVFGSRLGEGTPARPGGWDAARRREPAPASEPPRSPFGSRFVPSDRSARYEPGARPSFGRPRPAPRDPALQAVVFELPRPDGGWCPDTYRLEVMVGEEAKQTAQFRVVDRVGVVKLEPGQSGREGFDPSAIFLARITRLDCMVSLTDAPLNTSLSGRIYNGATGTLLGQSSAQAQQQGNQSVQLTWNNLGLQPGLYRIAVAVGDSPEVNTEIEIVAQIKARAVKVCHRVDDTHGAIGTGWPFYPDDTPRCVVELGPTPPGVEIRASWYQKNKGVQVSRPYMAAAAPEQRAAFDMPRVPGTRLEPGHYSVIVHGSDIAREEQSFEVLPYPRSQWLRRAAWAVVHRVLAWLRRYHLDKALFALGLTALLAVALLAADAGLEGIDVRFAHDAILAVGHGISRINLTWGLGWLGFGAVYGTLYARDSRNLGGRLEDRVYSGVNMALAAASGFLAWYQVTHLGFGAGHLWPDQLWGILKSVGWLAPGVAWLGPFAGVLVAEIYRQQQNKYPFHPGTLYTALGVILVLVTGYAGAVVIGLILGALGGIAGAALDAAGVGNDLGHAFRAFGAGAGFVAGPITAGLIYTRADLFDLWESWIEAKQKGRGRRMTLLEFLLNEKVPVSESWRWTRIALAALAALAVLAAALAAAFEPVVIPVLTWLYYAPDTAAFEAALSGAPLMPLLALLLLLVWPGLVYGGFRLVNTPDLTPDEARWVRRFGQIAVLPAILAPAVVALLSRALWSRALDTEIAVFWINRAAVVILAGVALGGWAALFWKQSSTVKFAFSFKRPSFEEGIVVVLALLAGIIVPVWLWAILVILALAVGGGAVWIARRIQ